MSSREEFMRSLGLTSDDMSKPEDYVPSKSKHGSGIPGSSGVSSSSNIPASSSSTSAIPRDTLRAKNSNIESSSSSSNNNNSSSSMTAAERNAAAAKLFSRQQEDDYTPVAQKRPQPQQQTAPAAGNGSAASRAEFLRSLGIDNAEAGSTVTSAPQQKQQQQQQQQQQASASNTSTTSASVRSAIRRSEMNGEEEAHNTPTPVTSSSSSYGPRGNVTSNNSSSYTNSRAPPTDYSSSYQPQQQQQSTPGGGSLPRRSSLNSSMSGLNTSTSGVALLDIHGVEVPNDASADDFKKHGNAFYEAGDFRKAVRLYSRAIDKSPNNEVLYSNRSAAYLLASKQMALDTRAMALRDADKCVELKPTWFKGYSRRGDALFKLERFDEACEAYRAALSRDPDNQAILASLEQCKACCAPKKDNSFAWSQPSGNLAGTGRAASSGRSVGGGGSGSGGMMNSGLDTSKSAHELMDEFRVASTRATGGSVSAADYRERELARFREGRRGGSTASGGSNNSQNTSQSNIDLNNTATSNNNERGGGAGGMNDSYSSMNNTSYSSASGGDAAAVYQQSLMEAYRRKKAMQGK